MSLDQTDDTGPPLEGDESDEFDESVDRSRLPDLGAFIRAQRKRGHLSLRRLAEMADVSNPYLSQIERGLRRPSADILKSIAGALSISAESLYVRAGILDEDRDPVDLEDQIRRDPALRDDQRSALILVYRALRAENEDPFGPDDDEPGNPAT